MILLGRFKRDDGDYDDDDGVRGCRDETYRRYDRRLRVGIVGIVVDSKSLFRLSEEVFG